MMFYIINYDHYEQEICTPTYIVRRINLYKPSDIDSADPDQTPQNAVSDQGLHCLLT